MMTDHDMILGALVGVGSALLIRYVWDRFGAADRVGQESRSDDRDLRTWMEGQLRELRGWLEGQFSLSRDQMARHDERIRSLETQSAVQSELCKLRHEAPQKRATDRSEYDPTKDRCHGGERQT